MKFCVYIHIPGETRSQACSCNLMATYDTILKFYFICQCELIDSNRQRHWLGGSKGAIMIPLSTYSLLSSGSHAKGIFEMKTPELLKKNHFRKGEDGTHPKWVAGKAMLL